MADEFSVDEPGTLEEAASSIFDFLSIGQIRRAIAAGAITLNGERARPSTAVSPGDTITLDDDETGAPLVEPVHCAMEILHDDADLLALDKPPGLAVVPERGSDSWPFMGMLSHHAQGCALCAGKRFRVVHRLDRDTSGVTIVAKSLDAARPLGQAFASGAVAKRYTALVTGSPAGDSGTIDAPIGPAPRGKAVMAVVRSGKPSVTQWRVAERLSGFTLLDVFPKTGRTHQIRVHLAHAGTPLAVDPMYGGAAELLLSSIKRGYKRSGPERPLMDRLALHCAEIVFPHPTGGAQTTVAAPLAEDFAKALKALRKWAAGPRAD